jgi:hypothetical protein
MYGDSSANIKETGVIEDNTCKLQGLKQNEKYYLRVCMKTSRGSYLCSNTESRSTLLVKKPTYTLSSNTLTIKYNNANIKGEAKYYFKSTIKGTSNINVKRCTLSNNIFTCDGNTTTIEKNTWYQSSSDQISVIEFRNTDKKTIENLSNRKNLKGLTFEFAQKYVLKNHNIEKFPTMINGIKYIGLDKINSNYYLIKECKCCHMRINISIYKKENFSPFCNSCSWSNLKNAKFYSLNYSKDKKGNLITVIKTKITIGKTTNKKYLIRFNIILNSKNYENLEDFKIAEKINIEYSKYLLDIFIKKHNLKYPNLLSNEVFLEFENSKIQHFEFIKHPKTIRVDEDCLNNSNLKKQQHLFKAKIQGFGINKNLNSKTVLLKEVDFKQVKFSTKKRSS